MKIRKLRGICVCAVAVILTIIGLLFNTGTGTGCSAGIGTIATICPLGAFETLLGAKNANTHWVICAVLAVLAVILFGKAFCSWGCPVPWLQRFFSGKKKSAIKLDEQADTLDASCVPASIDENKLEADIAENIGKGKSCALATIGGKRDGVKIDSRHIVLLGALASATIFGFPVFCLICPVGLSFATLIGLWNLLQFNETSWGMLIFPAILIIEVVFLRKWCFKFCPISALASLISKINFTWRPTVNKERCLREKGVDCHACVESCPQRVDPHSASIPECSKCHTCADTCPAKAISFPVYKKRR